MGSEAAARAAADEGMDGALVETAAHEIAERTKAIAEAVAAESAARAKDTEAFAEVGCEGCSTQIDSVFYHQFTQNALRCDNFG